MDEHRDSLWNLQPEEGQPDSGSGEHEASVSANSSKEASRARAYNDPVAEERSSFVEGLVGQPSLLERRSRRRVEDFLKFAASIPDPGICLLATRSITSERVAPASERSGDVEQQTQEDN